MHCKKLPEECASEWLGDAGSRPFLSSVSAHPLCGCSLGQLFRWGRRFRCGRNHWLSTRGWLARQGLVENWPSFKSPSSKNMSHREKIDLNMNIVKLNCLTTTPTTCFRRAQLQGSCRCCYFFRACRNVSLVSTKRSKLMFGVWLEIRNSASTVDSPSFLSR